MKVRLKRAVLTIVCLPPLFFSACQSVPSVKEEGKEIRRPPGVFLITIDTLRADYVGSYGGSIATPTIDAIARDGIRFESAISEVPLTLPAHASLLTGSYPLTTGVRDNLGYYLDEEFETIAERLQQAGYRTAAFVGSYVLSSKWGLDQGFEVYEDHFEISPGAARPTDGIERRAEEVVGLATTWIEGRATQDAPLFCWIHLFDPHDPYDPPEPFRSRYPEDPYGGEVAYTDAALGQVIDTLKRVGIYDDSLIIVAGDHGESLGAHGEPTHGFFLYEETLHVPLLMKLPARFGVHDRVVSGTAQLVDIAPTVDQISRLRGSSDFQGKGLLGAILGKESLEGRPAYSETYYPNQFGWSGLRSWRLYPHKYVLAPKPELYNLSEDPGETNDRAETEHSLAGRFREDLLAFEARHKMTSEGSARQDLSPADLERFASLGYIGGVAPLLSDSEESLPDPKDRLPEYQGINRAMTHLSRQEYGRAHAVLSVFDSRPESDTVRFLRGQAYFGMNRYQEAARELNAVVGRQGSNAYARFYLARTYLGLGNPERAEELLLELVETDDQFSPGYNYLGLIYSDQGKIDQAIEAFSRAVEIHEDSQAYQMLGYLFTRRSEPGQAARSLEKAVALDPGNALAYLYLANAYHLLGRGEQAREAYEKAFALDPSLREKLEATERQQPR